MAQAQKTLTVEAIVTSIRIDPVGQQLYLEGVLRIVGSGEIVRSFSENVTGLLDATDTQAAVRLVTRAQAWVDAKLAAL